MIIGIEIPWSLFDLSHNQDKYYAREVKDCTISRLLSMAMKMLFMMVRHAQKVKGEAENLNPSIAPRGHRVRRGNTRKKYAKL